MIIWTSPVTTEENIIHKDMGKRSWRWIIEIGMSHKFLGISLNKQYSSEKSPKWGHTYSYIDLHITPFFWRYGYDSMFHDTYHHSLSFGPIHLNWGD